MSDDGSVMPQAEIDALFKQATGRNIATAPAKKPSSDGASGTAVAVDTAAPAAPEKVSPPEPAAKPAPAPKPAAPEPPASEPAAIPAPAPKSASPEPPAPEPAAKPAPAPKPAAQPEPPAQPEPVPPPQSQPAPLPPAAVDSTPADDILRLIQATLDNLTKRLDGLEADVNRLNHKEKYSVDYGDTIHQLSQEVSAEAENIRKVSQRVDKVFKGLKNTPAYNARDGFTCESCGSHGLTAVFMKCTGCGKEGWWGWWPEE